MNRDIFPFKIIIPVIFAAFLTLVNSEDVSGQIKKDKPQEEKPGPGEPKRSKITTDKKTQIPDKSQEELITDLKEIRRLLKTEPDYAKKNEKTVQESLMRIHESLFNYGEYRISAAACDLFLEYFPANPAMLASCGRACAVLGETDRANEYFSKYIEMMPDHDKVRLEIADFYEKNFRWDQAVKILLEVEKKRPADMSLTQRIYKLYLNSLDFKNAEIYMEKILIPYKDKNVLQKKLTEFAAEFVKTGRTAESRKADEALEISIRIFEKAILINRTVFYPCRMLLDLFRNLKTDAKKNNNKELTDKYCSLMEKTAMSFFDANYDNQDIAFEMVSFVEESGEKETALNILQNIFKKNKNYENLKFLVLAGRIAGDIKNTKLAGQFFRKILAEEKDKTKAYEVLAEEYERSKDSKNSLHYYERLLQLNPGEEKYVFSAAKLYRSISKFSEESMVLKNFVKVSTDKVESGLKVANYFKSSSSLDAAVEQYNNLLAMEDIPKQKIAEVALHLGEIYLMPAKNNLKKAEENFIRYLDLSEDSSDALAKIGALIDKNAGFENLKITVLERKIKKNPSDPQGYLFLGDSYIRQKKYDQGFSSYQRFITLSSDKKSAVEAACRTLLKYSRYQEAIELYRIIEPSQTGNPPFHGTMGDLYSETGDFAKAREHYRALMAHLKNSNYPLDALADRLFSINMHDLAIEAYLKLLPLAGHDAKVKILYNLGVCYFSLSQKDKMKDSFSKFITESKDDFNAKLKVAKFYYENNYLILARTLYNDCSKDKNKRYLRQIFRTLIDINFKLGDMGGIEKTIASYLAVNVDPVDGLSVAAEEAARIGLHEKAIQLTDELIQKKPGYSNALEQKAKLLLTAGRFEEARDVFIRYVKSKGSMSIPSMYEKIGNQFDEKADYKDASWFYSEAMRYGNKSASLFFSHAVILKRAGKTEEFHEYLLRALDEMQEMDKSLEIFRSLYTDAGRLDLYSAFLNKALKKFTLSSDLALELATIYTRMGRLDQAMALFHEFARVKKGGAIIAGRVLYQEGYYSKALELYRIIPLGEQGELDPKILLEMASDLLFTGEKDLLEKILAFHVASADDIELTLRAIGDIYFKTGFYSRALDFIMKANAKRPVNDDYLIMGKLHAILGDDKQALNEFLKYIELLYSGAEIEKSRKKITGKKEVEIIVEKILDIFYFCMTAGKFREAEIVLDRAIGLFPDKYAFLIKKIMLLLMEGRTNETGDALKKILRNADRIDEDDLKQIARYYYYRKEKNFIKNILSSSDVKEIAPSRFNIYLSCILGENKIAGELVKKSGENQGFPASSAASNFLAGSSFFECGDFKTAKGYLMQTIRLRDLVNSQAALEMLVKISLLENNPDLIDEAKKILSDAIENRILFHEILGKAFFNTQIFDLSMEELAEFGRLDPRNEEAPFLMLEAALFSGNDRTVNSAEKRYIEISKYPEKSWERLILLYKDRMRYDMLRDILKNYLDRFGASIYFEMLYGKSLLLTGENEKALAVFEQYASKQSMKGDAYTGIGINYIEHFMFPQAKEMFMKAGKENPENIYQFVAAGTSIAKTGSGISAVLQFDRALALEKGVDAAVHSIQASYLLLTNHGSEDRWIVEKMKTVIEAAERKDLNSESALSANPYAYLLRGLALLNLGQNEESDQDFKRFLESNYDTYTGALIIASKMLENLRFDAASLYFDTAVKNSGSAESALLNIMKTISDFKERRAGELSSDQRKTIGEMGINYVDKLMFYGPLEVYYVTLKSDMLDIMGRNRESADVFYEAAAMVPTASGLFNNLSYMWAKQGSNLDEALKLVHRAMALEPNQNVYYLDTEGWIYYMQGKYSKAIDKIQKTVWQMREESGSSLSESFYHLGMAQMKNRDIDMAVKSFATAVRLGFLTYYGKISFGELKKMGKAPDLKW